MFEIGAPFASPRYRSVLNTDLNISVCFGTVSVISVLWFLYPIFVNWKGNLSSELGSSANSRLKSILNSVSFQEIHYHPEPMQRSYLKACKINNTAMGSGLKMLINVSSWTVGWGKIHYVLALPLSSVLDISYFNVTGQTFLAEFS